jgi:sulfur carrier protein ThiS
MAHISFTPALQRHIALAPREAAGATVREVLDKVFAGNARARSYVLDDQSSLRKHMVIFVNGRRIEDRLHLSDAVEGDDRIYVLQSLSGG